MKKRNLIAIITMAVMLIGSMGFAAATDPAIPKVKTYVDVSATHWAAEPIEDMSNKKIVTGYQDGSFKPAQILTYGEFIKMMVIATDGEELELGSKPNHWAYNYYLRGLELKLYSENDISKSALDQPIPRKLMALIISNALGDEKVDNYDQIEATVKDVDSTVKYDYHIIKAYAQGILSGYTDGNFKPDGTLNRAESTVVLQRFLEPDKRTPVTAEKPVNTAPVKEGSIANRGDDFEQWMQHSPSMKPIGELVSNYQSFFMMEHLKYGELITDYPEKMDIVLGKFGGTEFLRMPWGTGGRAAALIKDGKCIDDMTDYGDGKVGYSYYAWDREKLGDKLPDFDYIGFYVSTSDTILLVPNPFKNGYTIAEQL